MTHPAIPRYLHRISIPTPFPVGPVNGYLAEGAELTLVDTGPRYRPARQALTDGLASQSYRVADLRRIVLTHAHADHYGLAAEVARISGAEVLTHPASVSLLTENGSLIQMVTEDLWRAISYFRMVRWAGVPLPMILRLARMRHGVGRYAEPLNPDRVLVDGNVIQLGSDDWQVLHTPGHTGGLICLYQPERQVLISSDHLLRDISSNPIVDLPAKGEKEPPRRLVQYLQQLRRVAELDVAMALPGHGPPITDHRALIQERLSFHEERADRIRKALDGAALTAHQIAGTFFPQLDPINHFLAVSEVIGHLQWLETGGQVAQEKRGMVARWRAAI